MSSLNTPAVRPSPSKKYLKKDCGCDDCQDGKECPCDEKAMSWLDTNSGGALVKPPHVGDYVSVVDDKGGIWIEKGIVTFLDGDRTEVIGEGKTSGMFPNRFVKQLGNDLSHKHKFSSTQFNLDIAGYNRTQGMPVPKLQAIQDKIHDFELAEDGKEDNYHVTVKYGLHTNDPEDVIDVVKQWVMLRQESGMLGCNAILGDVSLFPATEPTMQRGGQEFDVVKVDVESEDLEELNQFLADNLEHTDTHPIYQPHVTLAYLRPGYGQQYVGLSMHGHKVHFSQLVFSDKDGEKYVIDFEELKGKDLSVGGYEYKDMTINTPKNDVRGKPCPPGYNTTRDGCTSDDVADDHNPEPYQQIPESHGPKISKENLGQLDTSKIQEVDKPSVDEVMGGSNLSPQEDWKANRTRSKAFKNWFGDWENDPKNASKVVDAETGEPKETGAISGSYTSKVIKDGKPVIVYHGTPHGSFDRFDKDKIHDPEKQLYGPGFYFTEDSEVADSYREKERPYKFTVSKEDAAKRIEEILRDSLHKKKVGGARIDSYVDTFLNTLKLDENGDSATKINAYVQGVNGVEESDIDLSSIMEPEKSGYRFDVFLNIRKPFDADNDRFTFDDLNPGMRKFLMIHLDQLHGNDIQERKRKLKKIKAAIEKGEDLPKWKRRLQTTTEELEKSQQLYDRGMNRIKSDAYSYDFLKDYDVSRKEVNDILASKGYDGITHIGGYAVGKGDRPHRVWIAFEPNQIKSTNNEGTFDPENPDMGKDLSINHKTAKQNVEGKPCPPGYNTTRDRCISDTNEVAPSPLHKEPKPSVSEVLGTDSHDDTNINEVLNDRGLLHRIANLPKTVVNKAIGFARKLYDKTEAKYGPRWAKAIVGTAIVTLPTPFTMGSVAAMTGLAHLWTKYISKTQAALNKAIHGDLTESELEELAMQFLEELQNGIGEKDTIPGGLADDIPYTEFDQDDLKQGIKVEMEHTDDPDIAREIAKDHLQEDADYYRKLRKMEGKDLSIKSIDDSVGVSGAIGKMQG